MSILVQVTLVIAAMGLVALLAYAAEHVEDALGVARYEGAAEPAEDTVGEDQPDLMGREQD